MGEGSERTSADGDAIAVDPLGGPSAPVLADRPAEGLAPSEAAGTPVEVGGEVSHGAQPTPAPAPKVRIQGVALTILYCYDDGEELSPQRTTDQVVMTPAQFRAFDLSQVQITERQ